MTFTIAALCAAVIRPLPHRVHLQMMSLDGRASREQLHQSIFGRMGDHRRQRGNLEDALAIQEQRFGEVDPRYVFSNSELEWILF